MPSQPVGVVNMLPGSETAGDRLEAALSQEGPDLSADTALSRPGREASRTSRGCWKVAQCVGRSVHGQALSKVRVST